MQGSGARRASIILGIFMAVVLTAGAIVPLLTQGATTTQTTEPTEAPVPTFPPPPSNLSAITFDQYYLHPTGLFVIPQPTGFGVTDPSSQPTIAQVNMVNQEIFSVIDAYVEDPLVPIAPADLDARFDQATLAQSWSLFNQWEELSRRMDGDTLLIDFQVEFQSQIYVARQRVWTDGEWIYVVRVLAPENATDYLVYLLDQLSSSMQPFKFFAGTPFNWQAYYDHLLSHIIRYPSGWTVTDSAPGRPTSITGTNGEALRVEAQPGTTIDDEEAARAWVESQRSGTTVLSVVPIIRGEASGFSVAYTFTTADGAPQSGLAVLLNGEDGTLHAANLRFPAEDLDLHTIDFVLISDDQVLPEATPAAEATSEATPEATAQATPDPLLLYYDLALSMSTFRLMPLLTLSPDSLPQMTPTPLPTALPPETTAEITPEATSESEATESASTAEATIEVEETEAAVEETATEEAEAETEAPVEEMTTEEATSAPTASNLERFATTATALAELRLTPTTAP